MEFQIEQTFNWAKFDRSTEILKLSNDGAVDNMVGIAILKHIGAGIVQFTFEFVVVLIHQSTMDKSIN